MVHLVQSRLRYARRILKLTICFNMTHKYTKQLQEDALMSYAIKTKTPSSHDKNGCRTRSFLVVYLVEIKLSKDFLYDKNNIKGKLLK